MLAIVGWFRPSVELRLRLFPVFRRALFSGFERNIPRRDTYPIFFHKSESHYSGQQCLGTLEHPDGEWESRWQRDR